MPDKVIGRVDEVTTEWLTAVLSGSGALCFDLESALFCHIVEVLFYWVVFS